MRGARMQRLRPRSVAQFALPLAVMSDDDPDYDTTEQVGETATRWQTSIEVPDELVDWIAEQAHAIEQLTSTRLDLYDSEVGNTRQRLWIASTFQQWRLTEWVEDCTLGCRQLHSRLRHKPYHMLQPSQMYP